MRNVVGVLLARRAQPQSKKRPTAFALAAAGAAGVALARRRRSAAADEPVGDTSPEGEQPIGSGEEAMGERAADEAPTRAADPEGTSAG